jgi:hypothetical protein
MSDILKIDGYLGRASAVLFGLTTATDNHGNSTSGFSLRCAQRPEMKLSFGDWGYLLDNLASTEQLIRFDGVSHTDANRESPLQTLCRAKIGGPPARP